MQNSARTLKAILDSGEKFTRAVVGDALSAKVAQLAGMRTVTVGGYALGARSLRTEPLLDLSFVSRESYEIQKSVSIPVTVDCGAGYGEAIQVWNTVKEMQSSGVAGIQIEDQLFPKRAHYHRDYQERTVSLDNMAEKISAAKEAITVEGFSIFTRTDAMKTHGYDEAVRRGNAYAKAGGDVVVVFPNTLEEAIRAPRDIDAPLCYVLSHGNRVGRPVIPADELFDMGYRVVSFAVNTTIAMYKAVYAEILSIKNDGVSTINDRECVSIRKSIEDAIGLEELYNIEERTTEK